MGVMVVWWAVQAKDEQWTDLHLFGTAKGIKFSQTITVKVQ